MCSRVKHPSSQPVSILLAAVFVVVGASLPACSANDRVDRRIETAVLHGQYGEAREALQKCLSNDPSDKSYLLDRLRLLILTLADGQPDAAELTANDLYALLRTQGLNADKTAASVVFNERVKIWKGEPFEQALAYTYIGLQKAMRGEWDNARAAAQSSLFLLRDFGENERGQKITADELAQRAAEAERRGKSSEEVIDRGYTPVKTDFALGYLLNGVANKALGRDAEASDNFNEASLLDAGLAPLCQTLAGDDYNTILVVDYGRGPFKQAYGPDDSLVRFMPITPSDRRGLRAEVVSPGGVREALLSPIPPTTDVNRMGRSLMWNSLEGVRQAKSVIGSAMVVGGLVVATAPQGSNESDESRRNRALIGAGVALAGLLLKGSSSADTRHCEFFPQRVYLVPLNIATPASSIELEVDGDASSLLSLTGLDPPKSSPIQLRYVHLEAPTGNWRTSGHIVYANDRYPWRVPGDDLPYLFGGRCARTPTSEVMSQYHAAGHLADMTSNDLANIYREEGITFEVQEQEGGSRKHILEGGTSLVCPLPGTVGFQRLFGVEHQPYKPRSDALKDAIKREFDRPDPGQPATN
ncbi:hypothetical protein PHYC_02601 [Phycisphaerales bacterium]|nr:hypothetical protein PHYC_02601 [Phycisphaerales bacterium]